MPSDEAAAPADVCSGIFIQAIDIVQPPGISIPPIAGMEPHQTVVNVVLAANISEETARTVCSAFRSEARRRRIHGPAVITCVSFRRLCVAPCRAVRNIVSAVGWSDESDKCGGIPTGPIPTSSLIRSRPGAAPFTTPNNSADTTVRNALPLAFFPEPVPTVRQRFARWREANGSGASSRRFDLGRRPRGRGGWIGDYAAVAADDRARSPRS